MLAAKRHEKIMELLRADGAVQVDQLAELFQVSVMTVRRDLEKMERDNLLVRCHGGAVPRSGMLFDVNREVRSRRETEAKERIAAYCVEHYVHENMIIYLDAGTTVLAMAKRLGEIPGLTVLTNDVVIAASLIDSSADVLMIGGKMQGGLGCVHGDAARTQLGGYRVDAAFVSSLCVDADFDVFAATESKVYFRRKLLEVSDQTYMLMHGGKMWHKSLYLINNLSAYTAMITDRALSPGEEERAAQAGVSWIVV